MGELADFLDLPKFVNKRAELMKSQGMSYNEIATDLGVSRRSVINWCKKP